VGIKMQQRQRLAVLFGVRDQQRVGDEVVAAEGQHLGAGGEDGARVLDDGRLDGQRVVRVEPAVTVVDHGQVVERVEAPRVGLELGQLHAGGTDGLRALARAGAVGDGQVQRNAGYHHVRAFQIARVVAAHEGQYAGVGVFDGGAVQALTTDGTVALDDVSHGEPRDRTRRCSAAKVGRIRRFPSILQADGWRLPRHCGAGVRSVPCCCHRGKPGSRLAVTRHGPA